MKTRIHLLGLAALTGSAVATYAQGFSIPWSTLDGGGGTSAAGSYSVTGTIAQPDAGVMTGGGFTLHGGFWSPEQPMAFPRLLVVHSAGGAVLSWTPNVPGFVLQTNAGASPNGWGDLPNGVSNPMTVPTDSSARFFRLRK